MIDEETVCPFCSGEAEALDIPRWFKCVCCGAEFKKSDPGQMHCG